MPYTIKELKREIERLKKLAYKDELTGLYNRHGFKDESNKFINEVAAHRKHPNRREAVLVKNFSLVIFDIDNFKKLNDVYGHQAGDYALKLLGELILKTVRDIDIVARWGGEEIIIGLIGATGNDALRIAEGIRKKIEEMKFKWHKRFVKFTVSGGVAEFKGVKNFEEIIPLG